MQREMSKPFRFGSLIDKLFTKGQSLGFLSLSTIIFVTMMLTSFFPLWVNVPINVLLPIYILSTQKMVMFEKLKLTTLLIMRFLVVFVLFNVMSASLFMKIVLVFLIINILEATFTDLLKNNMPYNFVTGLALAGSVLLLGAMWINNITGPYSGIYRTYIGSSGSPLFELGSIHLWASIAWIIAYTLWNWIFVMGEFSSSISFLHGAILGSPIVACLVLRDPGYWLVMRANSLTSGGIIQIACKESLEKNLENEKMSKFVTWMKTKPVQIGFMVINLALLGMCAVAYFN